MTDVDAQAQDPRVVACLKLLGRTGIREFQFRYSDDEEPVVWMAVGTWRVGPNGKPVATGGEIRTEVDAALNPLIAVFRLCERTLDGGFCTNCKRPMGVTLNFEPMPLREEVCWWQYDSDHEKFFRGCGDPR